MTGTAFATPAMFSVGLLTHPRPQTCYRYFCPPHHKMQSSSLILNRTDLKIFRKFTSLKNFARCNAMQGGKNSWNAITMQGGSGRAVVPWGWCQVAGSPAAAALLLAAKVAEVASNWSTTGLPLARTPQKLGLPCPRPSRAARHGPSLACAARASQ